MKKVFCACIVSAILVALLVTTAFAQGLTGKGQKQRVKIVVVEKKDNSGALGQTQTPENRGKRP